MQNIHTIKSVEALNPLRSEDVACSREVRVLSKDI